MIAGVFHQGSGLGNQLHRYVATRVLALDKGYDWGMMYNPDGSGKDEGFKGKSFMNLEYKSVKLEDLLYYDHYTDTQYPAMFTEKKVVENDVDIRGYDPEINFVQDGTIIDGEFQDPKYFEHRLDEIDEWLKVEPLDVPDDVCVIGFRGGEFSVFPDLYLTKEYWDEGIKKMREINPNMKFEVHTDDPERARGMFWSRDFHPEVIHDIGINWRSMRYAKHAIIANSSFYILPRLLKPLDEDPNDDSPTRFRQPFGNNAVTIAPRYWARRNTKVWALPQNYYKQFTYI